MGSFTKYFVECDKCHAIVEYYKRYPVGWITIEGIHFNFQTSSNREPQSYKIESGTYCGLECFVKAVSKIHYDRTHSSSSQPPNYNPFTSWDNFKDSHPEDAKRILREHKEHIERVKADRERSKGQ